MIRVTPPPGTTPSASAAFTAATASSTLYFFSSISVSVAPPTFITATFPDNEALLSRRLFLSKSFSAVIIWESNCEILLLTPVLFPVPSIIVVSSLVTITFRAEPTTSSSEFSNVIP